MNGAEALVKTLLANKVDVCFANPGTSEMHFVAALDRYPEMRCILGLFEGGVTGAADGYYRMRQDIAATLLHLGPGIGNGWANLHNAGKARSGILNIVGDHATWHVQHSSPLNSDLMGVAKSVSHWVRRTKNAESVAADCHAGVEAARQIPGNVATLILPADCAWDELESESISMIPPAPPKPLAVPTAEQIKEAAIALSKGNQSALYVGDRALFDGTLELAAKITAKTGSRLIGPFRSGRIPRGAGRVPLKRLTPSVALNGNILTDVQNFVMVGAIAPAAFFAYPHLPSFPFEPGCNVKTLADDTMDLHATLNALAAELDALNTPIRVTPLNQPKVPTGEFTKEAIGIAIGAMMPENAIIVDESITSGRSLGAATMHSAPHDWLQNTGGSIGQGLPNAVGAAVACPHRKVICLEGDGSAMYTIQSLWTMARENLNVLIVIFANKGYQVLRQELTKVGVTELGQNAINMLEVSKPEINWVQMSQAQGVAAGRAESLEAFVKLYQHGLSEEGPFLIEAKI